MRHDSESFSEEAHVSVHEDCQLCHDRQCSSGQILLCLHQLSACNPVQVSRLIQSKANCICQMRGLTWSRNPRLVGIDLILYPLNLNLLLAVIVTPKLARSRSRQTFLNPLKTPIRMKSQQVQLPLALASMVDDGLQEFCGFVSKADGPVCGLEHVQDVGKSQAGGDSCCFTP